MPSIDWTADQGEEVRQLILDRLEYLTVSESRAGIRKDTSDLAALRALREDMREILKKLEAAYAIS
jgi:hypothetical protein